MKIDGFSGTAGIVALVAIVFVAYWAGSKRLLW